MAAITFITRASGVNSLTRSYAATDTLLLTNTSGNDSMHVCYAQLTGSMTINVTATGLLMFDKVVFYFSTDATQRIVTFGTGFVSSGTVTIPASEDAIVTGYFDGTNIRISSREIGA